MRAGAAVGSRRRACKAATRLLRAFSQQCRHPASPPPPPLCIRDNPSSPDRRRSISEFSLVSTEAPKVLQGVAHILKSQRLSAFAK